MINNKCFANTDIHITSTTMRGITQLINSVISRRKKSKDSSLSSRTSLNSDSLASTDMNRREALFHAVKQEVKKSYPEDSEKSILKKTNEVHETLITERALNRGLNYWEQKYDPDVEEEEAFTRQDLLNKPQFTATPRKLKDIKDIIYILINITEPEALSDLLLHPIPKQKSEVYYNLAQRAFEQRNEDHRRDVCAIALLHIQAAILQQALINRLGIRSIREGEWAFQNILDSKAEALFHADNKVADYHKICTKFRDIFRSIMIISKRRKPERTGIISYEEALAILKFKYNTFSMLNLWPEYCSSADARFKDGEMNVEFHFDKHSIELITTYILYQDRSRFRIPEDNDAVVEVSLISMAEKQQLPPEVMSFEVSPYNPRSSIAAVDFTEANHTPGAKNPAIETTSYYTNYNSDMVREITHRKSIRKRAISNKRSTHDDLNNEKVGETSNSVSMKLDSLTSRWKNVDSEQIMREAYLEDMLLPTIPQEESHLDIQHDDDVKKLKKVITTLKNKTIKEEMTDLLEKNIRQKQYQPRETRAKSENTRTSNVEENRSILVNPDRKIKTEKSTCRRTRSKSRDQDIKDIKTTMRRIKLELEKSNKNDKSTREKKKKKKKDKKSLSSDSDDEDELFDYNYVGQKKTPRPKQKRKREEKYHSNGEETEDAEESSDSYSTSDTEGEEEEQSSQNICMNPTDKASKRRADSSYGRMPLFTMGSDAQYFIKQIYHLAGQMYPQIDERPNSRQMYTLMYDKLDPEVRQLVNSTREVHPGDAASIRRFLRRHIGKIRSPLADIQDTSQYKPMIETWGTTILKIENNVGRLKLCPKECSDPAQKALFYTQCWSILYPLIPTDIREKLTARGVLRDTKPVYVYPQVKAELIKMDNEDRLIYAGRTTPTHKDRYLNNDESDSESRKENTKTLGNSIIPQKSSKKRIPTEFSEDQKWLYDAKMDHIIDLINRQSNPKVRSMEDETPVAQGSMIDTDENTPSGSIQPQTKRQMYKPTFRKPPNTPRPQRRTKSASQGPSNISCFKCHEKGHYASDCRRITGNRRAESTESRRAYHQEAQNQEHDREQSTSNTSVKPFTRQPGCIACKGPGHISDNCPTHVLIQREDPLTESEKKLWIHDKLTCQWCHARGHSIKFCKQYVIKERSQINYASTNAGPSHFSEPQ